MIDGRRTEWEKQQMNRLKKEMEKKPFKWEAIVVNSIKGVEMNTGFNSDAHDLDNVTHKVELDLMTNLLHGFEMPIQVGIRRRE